MYLENSDAFRCLREVLLLQMTQKHKKNRSFKGSHGVMVSTLDSESKDPSSSLGGTSMCDFHIIIRSRSNTNHELKIRI